MDALTSIHGRRIGLGPNDELLLAGKTIIMDNAGVPTPVIQIGASRYLAGGSTRTLTGQDSGKTVKLDTLTGSVVTLPAASGSGARFKFLVTVLATSNSHKVQVANAQDFMIGIIMLERTDTNVVLGFAAANSGTVATNSDTITLNRTTTGSVVVGEWIEVEDVAANTWEVRGMLGATTAQATPFTAAV
ncbi:hypothetical protein ACVWXN_003480 [Bradyrhizobium sp. i1.4.4]